MHGTDNYQPQPGDIGLTQIAGYVGAGIRVLQFLNGDGFWNYQHAFTVVTPAPGRVTLQIVEAEPGGAQLNPLSRYAGYNVSYLRCPDDCRTLSVRNALHMQALGVGYSYADYLSLAVHRFHINTPHLKTYIEASGHQICSQLTDYIAALSGWHLFADGRWPGDVTPGDLYGVYREQQTRFRRDDIIG